MEQLQRATRANWMYPPIDGWTVDQVEELCLPYDTDWELIDGRIVTYGDTSWWHNHVRDELYVAVRTALRRPYTVDMNRWTEINNRTAVSPDLVVFDRRDLDIDTLVATPLATVALVVEVYSPRSHATDRHLRPGLFAEAGIGLFWQVERGKDAVPEVHEHHLDPSTGRYREAARHTGMLKTDVPFPIEVDLRSLIDL
ncbi:MULTISPECIES: Uma2 family endonuclease [Streptomyces]|uniref:Uma2 family endonuclease n=1 Tax=Streptomyces luteosporeus TaxID=173856 RepID=A0ABP6GMD2_9ACTN